MASKPIRETTESGHVIDAHNNGYRIWVPLLGKGKEGETLYAIVHEVDEKTGSDSFTNIQRAKMWLENQKAAL